MELIEMNIFFASILLFLGLYAIMRKSNLIKIIIGLEIMAKAALLSFVASGGASIQSIVIIVIAIDAIVAAMALSIVVNVWKKNKTLDAGLITRLRG